MHPPRALAPLLLLSLPLAAAYGPAVAPRSAVMVSTTATRARAGSMQAGGGGGLWRQLVGTTAESEAEELQRDLEASGPAEDMDFVPLVLVVGAAGRTGRIIVRKLVLQGFRVAVLVRSLSTDTLNLLGTGVTYSYGDMTDYRALLDAMEDVDRVIFAAECDDPETEHLGLQTAMRAFQDTRTFMYGEAEATKLTLLKMRRDSDFDRWKVEDSAEEIANRLASAGIGPEPAIAYWKRSPTAAHNNGIFVGKVFDTYLGSAAVSCSLSGLLVGPPPALGDMPPATPLADTARPTLLGGGSEGAAAADAEPSDVSDSAEGASDDVTDKDAAAELNRQAAAIAANQVPLDLGEYSGINLRAIGDGQSYTVVLRTPEFAKTGVEYHQNFPTRSTRFETARLAFSNFVAVRGGRPVTDAPELDRRRLMGLGVAFYPQRNQPESCTGEFYISVSNIKAYRKRDEPEFVYISDAEVETLRSSSKTSAAAAASEVAEEEHSAPSSVPAAAAAAAAAERAAAAAVHAAAGQSNDDGDSVAQHRPLTKHKGEELIRASGLTYFIVRPTKLDDRPTASGQLAFTQGAGAPQYGTISRTDVAEVAVKSLLDPRACNVACTVTDSPVAAPSGYEQDISKALEVLVPNKL